MRWAGAVAGVVVAGGAAVAVWGLPGLSADSASTDGADPVDVATPQGLAAAVDAHLDDAELVEAVDSSQGVAGHPGPELRVDLSYDVGGEMVDFSVGATEDLAEWQGVERVCAQSKGRDRCALSEAADGSPLAVLHVAADPGAPGFSMVAVHRGDQIVFATEAPPAETALADLPVPVDVLREIVVDPLVGLSTSAGMNARGEHLPFRG